MLLFFGLVPPCDSLAVVTEMRLIVPPHNGLPLHDTCECVCACMCVIRTDIYIYIYISVNDAHTYSCLTAESDMHPA